MIDNNTEFEKYLEPTEFIDFNSPEVRVFVDTCVSKDLNTGANMVLLYYKVRDSIWYDTHNVLFEPSFFKASNTINNGFGFCIPKAIVLAAVARAIGVPSRLGYVDVTNHLASEKVKEQMRSNIFVFHSYTDLYLDGKWVKATPAFNISLCDKFDVEPLDFNGSEDSLFQQYNKNGEKYMEYLKDHGIFADLPYEKMIGSFRDAYPHMYEGLIENG
jgi:transglutaminase-like putative cysteine protease